MKIFSPILKGTTTVAQGTTNLSGSFTGSLLGTAATASYADNFTVGGTLTAQTINVQIITSSIEFNTGSTRNGSTTANTHQFTGSVLMTGSLSVTGSAAFSSDVLLPYSKALAFNSISNQYITADASNLYLGTANLARLIIASTGNTTIMTNDNVVLKATNVNQAMYIDYRNSAGTRRSYMGFGGDSNSNFDIWNSENGAIIFGANNAERMRITAGGSILITKNNIIGANTSDGSDDGYLFLCSAGAAGASRGAFVQCFGNEYSGDSGVLQLCAGNTGAAGYINFRTGDGGDRMRITINGSIGAPTGTNIYNPSDIRLKQNISTTTYGLNTISLLNPVKFNWKDGFEPTEDGKDMLGFVAQEVLEVIPEAVELFGGDISLNGETITTPLRVNEKFIIPVLVKAIQELSAKNTSLEERLTALENN